MKRKILIFFVFASFVLTSVTVDVEVSDSIGVQNTLSQFNKNTAQFVASTEDLLSALQLINKEDSLSVYRAKKALKDCRLAYKRIEYFTEYFFPSETRMYNAAAKYEVEEPTLELIEPMGLQQIEALLLDNQELDKPALLEQATALYTSVADLKSLLYQFKASDQQILESLRIELVRMSTLSMSGYDAPLLKSGISETLEVTKVFLIILKPYLSKDSLNGEQLTQLIKNSIGYLEAHQDFDSFNRMEYLVKFALPMQKKLKEVTRSLGLELNTTQFLNHNADHVFSGNALKSLDLNPDLKGTKDLTLLGEKLFFDKALSGNLSVSCSTCHQPQNYFADPLPKSPSLHQDSILKRNTPTLLYAGWQHTQFWDGRASSLQEQIKNVIFNPIEMDGKRKLIYHNVILNDGYRKLFQRAFPKKEIKDIGIDQIALAITSFIKQLDPLNSPFDHYIRGNPKAMTESQINGFNLFMGKAQCGTCHFAPYFNSLVPPLYDFSEVEVIGTTHTDNLDTPVYDNDFGRFDLYRIQYYKSAFKTPTVRNAAKTAPYMHNGAFKSLNSVLDFYNRGGGKGLGLPIEDQSLSSRPLNLSAKEMEDIIQFIHSLTDSIKYKTSNY